MFELEITPEQAGWAFCGLRVLQGDAAFDSGEDELIVLPLEGGAEVTVDGETFTLRGRDGVFAGPTDFVYAPRDARVEIAAEGRVALPSSRAFNGREARYVDEARALPHVVGYCIVNDVSERAFQMEHGGTTTKGKSADTFGPVGPWLVTADEIADPQGLRLWTTVNGERRQDGNTRHMVFPVRELVAYVSRFMSLQPGDLISTGTPAGVGHGARPPRYLQPGDIVEMGIDYLGVQRHVVTEWKPGMRSR